MWRERVCPFSIRTARPGGAACSTSTRTPKKSPAVGGLSPKRIPLPWFRAREARGVRCRRAGLYPAVATTVKPMPGSSARSIPVSLLRRSTSSTSGITSVLTRLRVASRWNSAQKASGSASLGGVRHRWPGLSRVSAVSRDDLPEPGLPRARRTAEARQCNPRRFVLVPSDAEEHRSPRTSA